MACWYKSIVLSVVVIALAIWSFLRNRSTGMESHDGGEYIELDLNMSQVHENILI